MSFIRNAVGAKDHAHNVQFQVEEVAFWLKRNELHAAKAKADCCLRSAVMLVARLEADLRAADVYETEKARAGK